MSSSVRLTRPQRRELQLVASKGFVPWFTHYRGLPRHRCYHRLMDLGLVEFRTSPQQGYYYIGE